MSAPYRWGFRLNRIMDVLNEHANRQIRPHGLGIPGMRVLLWLFDRDQRRVGELASDARIDPSAMSHIIRRLAGKGLIRRDRVAEDNRSVVVSLTPEGRKVAEALTPHFRVYDDALVKGFTEEEKDLLQHFLDRMDKNVRAFSAAAKRQEADNGPEPKRAR